MKFSYTALSKSNKKLNGLLEAHDLEGAKEELHKMGLSIVSMREISDSEYDAENAKQKTMGEAKGVVTFFFEATDNKGKDVQGTIDALNLENACERLLREYQFKIHSLFPEGATKEDQKKAQEQLKTITQRYKTESKKTDKPDEDAQEEVDPRVVAEIDQVIQKTKEAILKHAGLFSGEHLGALQNKLGELERVRQSNNLNHIAEICHKIYELLRAPDQWEKSTQETKNQFQTILKTVGQSALINKDSALYEKITKLKRIQTLGQSILESVKQLGKSKEEIGQNPTTFSEKIKKALGAFRKKSIQSADTNISQTAEASDSPSLKKVTARLKDYLSAKDPVIRQTRKHELAETWHAYREFKKNQKEKIKQKNRETKIKRQTTDDRLQTGNKGALIEEIDSFLSWLLVFYLGYLFLASFTLEKNSGLPRTFISQTLKTPLIINITIFLFISHLIFFVQKKWLKGRWIASLFLFSLSCSGYLLMIFNL